MSATYSDISGNPSKSPTGLSPAPESTVTSSSSNSPSPAPDTKGFSEKPVQPVNLAQPVQPLQPQRSQERGAESPHPRVSKPKPRSFSSSVFEHPSTSDVFSSGHIINSGRPPKPTGSKPRSRSSVQPRSKLRQSSFSSDAPSMKPLNTHSPIAVAAAAAVTSDKIRKLLITQGPLPIRHITSHLASTIPGFGELSLSKQRRLIIAVLDGPKSEFVKVGWGRWAVDGHGADRKDSLGGMRSVFNAGQGGGVHRESISRRLPDSKPPLSPSLGPVEDSAVFSDSDSSDYDDSEVEGTDEEDWQAIGPAQLRQTSPREQDAIAALVQLRSN